MPAVTVDTNVLARGPLGDDPVQQEQARDLMAQACAGAGLVVSAFAILELAWVLRVRKLPRPAVAKAIRTLLEAEGVTVTHAEALHQALARYEGGRADLGECLIWADGQAFGARAFASLDRVPQEEGWASAPRALLAGPP
jgi:predicted nucleic-acid-binding protein